MRTATSSVATILATGAAALLLAGCSGEIHVGGAPKLSRDKLADTVAQKLADTTGRPEPDITCPEDLTGKVGASARCTLTADDGSTLGVTVTVTSVDGSQVDFDIKADDHAAPAS
jgi:hypothetical protein